VITAADLQGHWRRDWLTAPGFRDDSTRVHWLQAGAGFVDIRVPRDRPDTRGVSCLAELDPPALGLLLRAEGFAGEISVEGGTCTWQREINWRGLPEAPDVGALSRDATGALREDGVHAEYRELWQPEPVAPLRAHRIGHDGAGGLLIENDDIFLFGIGPAPAGDARALIAAIEAGEDVMAKVARVFDSLYALGRWDGTHGVATLATDPLVEGTAVLERGMEFTWHARSFRGDNHRRRLAARRI